MKSFFLVFVFIFSFHGCAKAVTQDENLTPFIPHNAPLLTKYILGKPDIRYFNAEKKVAKKWGINLKHIFAGCVITPERTQEREQVEANNKKANKYYEEKLGKSWEERFQKAVTQEIKTAQKGKV